MREKEGAPGFGRISKIPCDDSVVAFIVGDELFTKDILNDEEKKSRITKVGGVCLDLLLKDPTLENFLILSRRFSNETGLLSREVRKAMEKLEQKDVSTSMAMLGNCLFTITDDPESVCEMLDFKYIVADIDHQGVRLV